MPSSPSEPSHVKRQVDLQIITDWIDPDSRILDLGCGRGIFLEHLKNSKNVRGIGVDIDFNKTLACIQRGLTVYQGTIETVIGTFPNNFFDWVLCSRTLEELDRPAFIIEEALRVGHRMAVGFVNYGFWVNRLSILRRGYRATNDVYPHAWSQSRPFNPLAIDEFEHFCAENRLYIERKAYLKGDWQTPCTVLPNLRSGYALYAITH